MLRVFNYTWEAIRERLGQLKDHSDMELNLVEEETFYMPEGVLSRCLKTIETAYADYFHYGGFVSMGA